MHSAGSRRLTSLILASLGFFLVAADAPLAATASADVVLVREGEIVDEDLYALGNTITIDGVIEGDLVFFAYDRIDIRGEVKGDVIGVAPIVRISGQVGGSVRLVGLDLSAAGEVGSDVFAAGWKVTTGGSVGRDVLAWTRSLTINGSVGRDVEGQTWGPTVIGGSIGRDVEMSVSSMELLAGAYVGQDLGYRSDLAAVIDAEAGVGGAIVQREPVSPNVSVSAARMVAFVLGLVGFLWLGIMSIWVMPATMERAVGLVRSDVLRTAASGIAAIISPLVMVLALFIIAAMAPPELALTILGVGAPFWLGLTVALVLAAMVAPVPVLVAVGRRLRRGRWSAFASFVLLAVPFVVVAAFVPIIGSLLLVGVVVIGLGALVRGALAARGGLGWASGRAADVPGTTMVGREPEIVLPPELYAVESLPDTLPDALPETAPGGDED